MTRTTVADVEDLLDRTFTGDSADRVTRLITRAEGKVAAWLPGISLEEVADAEVTLTGDGDDYLLLPRYPVTAVASVTVCGTPLASTDYTFDRLGRLRRVGGRWPDVGPAIVVAYSYGFVPSAFDPAIASVVAELVAARVNNPSQVTQESIGDRSQSFAQAAGAGDALTDGQKDSLKHWRRHRVYSSRVRS